MLGFDVAQFFPSVNHDLLIQIMNKSGFNCKLCKFTSAYFGLCSLSFVFKGNTSPTFNCPSVGVGQGLSLSPTFLAIYLAPAIHTVHSTMSITSTFGLQFYMDDSNLTASSTSTETTCHILHIVYHALEHQLSKLGLVIEHDKDELIHFPPPTNNCTCHTILTLDRSTCALDHGPRTTLSHFPTLSNTLILS